MNGSRWLVRSLVTLAVTLASGCQEKARPAQADAAATPPASAASAAPVASPLETELLVVVKRWNDALAKRDAQGLGSVYGARVRLYAAIMDRDAAIKAKATAFAAAKDYTQSIAAVEIDARDAQKPKAVFDKKWTSNGKEQSVRGSLGFAKEGGQWVVVDESDAKTDERRARAAKVDSCESAIVGVVASTPEASKFLAGPTNPKGGHASNGLRIGDGPPDSPTYSVAMHENHDTHLVTFGWFDVDPKTGAVTKDGEPQKADPAAVAKVKSACAR